MKLFYETSIESRILREEGLTFPSLQITIQKISHSKCFIMDRYILLKNQAC